MLVARAYLKSITPYSQSRMHTTPKKEKESADAYEERTWREKAHYDHKTRHVYIPSVAFKFAIEAAARFLSEQIPGKGKATWTKHFKSGIIIGDQIVLPVKIEDVRGETFPCDSKGQRGGSTRVMRTFPMIDEWEGAVTFYLADATITKDVFEKYLRESGKFIGIGRHRPENGGFLGRFEVSKVEWSEN
jgi:hypothetical protein